jgi:hypothetical protein
LYAWGGVKVMLALRKVPPNRRTPAIEQAIEMGAALLLSWDPAAADYPMGNSAKPNQSWFKFGYPIGFVTETDMYFFRNRTLRCLRHCLD